MSLRSELQLAARRAGGSHKTLENRIDTVGRFADFLRDQRIHITQISQIKTSHLQRFITAGQERGLSARTLQNETSGLRVTLRAAGRDKLASNLNNGDLGIACASRLGARTAIADDRLAALRAVALAMDSGVVAAIDLQRALGLRGKEAVMSAQSLKTWERALSRGQPVRVISGTKGGRTRDVRPSNPERALAAVRSALALTSQQGGRLIDRPDLKSALLRYARVMHAAGFVGHETGHAMRYAFAQEQIRSYIEQGFCRAEALAQTSLDLGHGDGRGRWIEAVYSR